jgi:hypothetical protein
VARRKLRRADDELIAAMRAGDAGEFFGAIRQVQNAQQCLRRGADLPDLAVVGREPGRTAGYAVCPADEENFSGHGDGMMFKGRVSDGVAKLNSYNNVASSCSSL